MKIELTDEDIAEEFKKWFDRKPNTTELKEIKIWFEKDIYEWIKENIKAYFNAREDITK